MGKEGSEERGKEVGKERGTTRKQRTEGRKEREKILPRSTCFHFLLFFPVDPRVL